MGCGLLAVRVVRLVGAESLALARAGALAGALAGARVRPLASAGGLAFFGAAADGATSGTAWLPPARSGDPAASAGPFPRLTGGAGLTDFASWARIGDRLVVMRPADSDSDSDGDADGDSDVGAD